MHEKERSVWRVTHHGDFKRLQVWPRLSRLASPTSSRLDAKEVAQPLQIRLAPRRHLLIPAQNKEPGASQELHRSNFFFFFNHALLISGVQYGVWMKLILDFGPAAGDIFVLLVLPLLCPMASAVRVAGVARAPTTHTITPYPSSSSLGVQENA